MKTINDIIYNVIGDSQIERYLSEDSSLIVSKKVKDEFGLVNDNIELHVYDYNDQLLKSDYEYNNYKVDDSYSRDTNQVQTLLLNPVKDLVARGYKYGYYKLIYNFFRNVFPKELFIKEISSDRLELRLSSNTLSDSYIENIAYLIINEINRDSFTKDYVLNFGDNNLSMIINIALDNKFENKELLLKLYEPLPAQFDLKSICSVEELITDSHLIEIELDKIFELEKPKSLKSANFDIDIENKYQLETDYKNHNDLLSELSYSSSLNSILTNKSYEININYDDFSDFVHFGSASERILNFVYKVTLVENFQTQIDNINITGSIYNLQNQEILQNNIKNIFTKFDDYDKFLYEEKYPRSGSVYYSVTSSQFTEWIGSNDEYSAVYGGLLKSSSQYDEDNKNNLIYSMPEYLRIDERNKPYGVFLSMIGQHFDYIWTYIKKSVDINKANNNLKKGISKDLVYEVLKDFGLKIYNTNDYSFFDSFKTNQITSSLDIDSIFSYTKEDLDAELYKRIYHNLPYLLKTKGTERGIRSLMAIFGIPDTIYRINEFGGFEKNNLTTVNIDSIATYKLDVPSGSYLTAPFKSGSLSIPYSTYLRYASNVTQSQQLFRIYSGSTTLVSVDLVNVSQSYSDIKLTILSGSSTVSSSIQNYPILNGNFYDLNLNINDNSVVLNVQTQINGKIGYKETASLSLNNYYSTLNLNNSLNFRTGQTFTGSIQNIQYHSASLSDDVLQTHTLNPLSTEPYNSLTFEIPLGIDLNTYNLNQTSSINNVIYTGFPNKNNFSILRETTFYNSPNVGIRTVVNDKINYVSSSLEDNVLSPIKSFQTIGDYNKTNNLNFLEIAFSPTYEINEDIISSFGNLNIDNYIGNPLDDYQDRYVDLDVLRNDYFSKYVSTYNYADYFRLIKYFDNSLFKMLKDFVPYRANLSTGIIIKQHILERSKYKRIPIEANRTNYFKEINVENISGSFSSLYGVNGRNLLISEEIKHKNHNKFLTHNLKLKDEFKHSYFNILKNTVQRNSFDRSQDISYRTSRYDGVKLFGYKENIYNINDKTYGKNPILKRYTGKLGIFTEVVTNPVLPNKSVAHLRYLVDKDGNLTELNRNNKNIFEIQNSFKEGINTTISLFDNNKYDRQKSLDGAKDIFKSGYDYSPIIYFKNGESNLKFNFLDNQQERGNSFLYKNNNELDITNKPFVYELFTDRVFDSDSDFYIGSVVNETFPYYRIPSDGNYTFYLKVPIQVKLSKPNSRVSYSLTLYKNSPLDSTKIVDKIEFEYTNPSGTSSLKYKSIGNPMSPSSQERERFNTHWSNEVNSLAVNIPFISNATWEIKDTGQDDIGFWIIYVNSSNYLSGKVYNVQGEFRDYYMQPTEFLAIMELPLKNNGLTTNLNNYYNTGDRVYVVLQQKELNINERIANSIVLKTDNRIALNSSGENISQNTTFINSISGNKILFNKEVSNFYAKSIFLPYDSQLYSTYKDVNEKFILTNGDLIMIKTFTDNKINFFEVRSIVFQGDGSIGCYVKDEFPNSINANSYSEIVFIKKSLDETVVVLNFKKSEGSTSYGFLIPTNINPEVLLNVDKINKQVKDKLINENDINIIPYSVNS